MSSPYVWVQQAAVGPQGSENTLKKSNMAQGRKLKALVFSES